jgi:Protein of unknown function DUF262
MSRNIAPQDITWFLDLQERGRLDLSPPYQRRSVWSTKERKYLLDTIFNGYPCPPLFLYKSISDQGIATFHVVDGKQRLETVINFVKNKLSMPIDFDDQSLAGKKWRQLNTDQKKTFWNYQFAVEMLDIIDPATVREIFGRYNRTSKNLEPQELRHAKYDGWFVTTAEGEARKIEWSRLGISTTAKARRMKDVQFISELMIQTINKGELIGFDQDQIDLFYANYEVPAEFDPNFSEDEYIERFESIKNKVLAMEEQNQCITQYAKSSTHFYTLWTILSNPSYELPSVEIIADRYYSFMYRVFELAESESPENLLNNDPERYSAPFQYWQNARGANTEQPQRSERNDVLLQALMR